MLGAEPLEIEAVIAFFRKHIGHELDIVISLFDGFSQRERLQVAEVGEPGPRRHRVRLISSHSHWELEIDLDHFSYATVSRDKSEVEIQRLLGNGLRFQLIASEIR